MLSHLLLGTNDLASSHQFYGFERYVWNHDGTRLMVATPRDGEPSTHYNGFTLRFKTRSIEQLHRALA